MQSSAAGTHPTEFFGMKLERTARRDGMGRGGGGRREADIYLPVPD